MNTAYWSPNHREPAEREELLLSETLNALSGRYCDWSKIVALEPKPPILWTQGRTSSRRS